jgi:succinyl-diaminopimelate desuccinylase
MVQPDPASALSMAQALIRCASVTPADDGALGVLEQALKGLGFSTTRLTFGQTPNLFARIGDAGAHFCFAGHTDVVPAGAGSWRHDPFGGVVEDGVLYGRGACDMKGGIAAFVAAVAERLKRPLHGSISLLITGDEEGLATDGTVKVLEWMRENHQIPDFCLVGEPTNPRFLGEVVKIGRRGSVNFTLTVHGIQGHAAYPHLADNPVHRLVAILQALTAAPRDAGSAWFEPTTLQITSVDVGNPAANVIPAAATAKINMRFNDLHSSATLTAWLRAVAEKYAERFDLDAQVSGESFLTAPGPDVEKLARAIARTTGRTPKLDTGGGTSDARFIANYCPVAEFGLVGQTMHKTDECASLADLEALTRAYVGILDEFIA